MRRRCISFAAGLLLYAACGRGEDRAAPPAANAPPPAAGYVGAARCAGCHAAQTAAWRGSHHDRAMQAADRGDACSATSAARVFEQPRRRARRFSRRDERFVVPHRGPGRRARRLRGRVHLRRRARCSSTWWRAPGRPPPGAARSPGTRGPRERGRTALVLAAPRRARAARRRAALDEASPELEHPVRRVPLDGPAQGLRRRARRVRRRPGRELDVACEACHGPGSRHVAWAERAGAGAATAEGDSASPCASRARDPATGSSSPTRRSRGAQRRARPRRARDLRALPRAPLDAARGPAARRASARHPPALRCSSRASTTPTARSATRSTSTAPSCRAACTPPA